MTTSFKSLSHSKWDCKYHIVFVPKNRQKSLYGRLKPFLREVFHELAKQKSCEILGGHLVQDHVHMLISIPPKYKVSEIVGYLKGKSAISIARNYNGRKRNYTGERFWARGYAISTVGYELNKIKEYVKNQQCLDGFENDESGEF